MPVVPQQERRRQRLALEPGLEHSTQRSNHCPSSCCSLSSRWLPLHLRNCCNHYCSYCSLTLEQNSSLVPERHSTLEHSTLVQHNTSGPVLGNKLELVQHSKLEPALHSKLGLGHMASDRPEHMLAGKRERILARHSNSLCGCVDAEAGHHMTTHRHNVTIATWRSNRHHKNFHHSATLVAWPASHHRRMNLHHNFRQAGS